MKVLLATRNNGKIAELGRILAPLGFEVVGTDDAPAFDDLPETGATFAANAAVKAEHAAEATGLLSVADDSGLCVDALGGMPGILSARWAGRHGEDAANLHLVLAQLRDTPGDRRGAAFHCAAAVAEPGEPARTVHGVMRGVIAESPVGTGGFGYDPIFVPVGESRTSAQLTPAEKDAISHRGQAFRALAELLALSRSARR